MRRQPKRPPRRTRPYRLDWEWLEDRCLLTGGLLSAAPVAAVPAVLPAAPDVVTPVSPAPAPPAVASDPTAAAVVPAVASSAAVPAPVDTSSLSGTLAGTPGDSTPAAGSPQPVAPVSIPDAILPQSTPAAPDIVNPVSPTPAPPVVAGDPAAAAAIPPAAPSAAIPAPVDTSSLSDALAGALSGAVPAAGSLQPAALTSILDAILPQSTSAVPDTSVNAAPDLTGGVATPPESGTLDPSATVAGLLQQTAQGGLLDAILPASAPPASDTLLNARPAQARGAGTPSGSGDPSPVEALTGSLSQSIPVLGQVEQTASAAFSALPVQTGGAGGSPGSGGPLDGGQLLDLSVSAGVSLGGSSGSGAKVGVQVGLAGDTTLGAAAGAGLGQNGVGLGGGVTAGSGQADGTGPGLAMNAGADLGGGQVAGVGVTTAIQTGSSDGTASAGAGSAGVDVGAGVGLNLAGTAEGSADLGAPVNPTAPPGPGPTSGSDALLSGNLAVGTGDGPAVSAPPVVGEGPGNTEGGSSAPVNPSGTGGVDQVPPVADAPPVAVPEAPPESGGAAPARPVTPEAVPLARELFVNPDPAEATRDLPNEPAAVAAGERAVDGLAGNLGMGAFFADSALWGAADGNLGADDVVAYLVMNPGFTPASGAGAAAPEVVLPDGAVDLPASREAGLLTACVPYDVQTLDAAFRRLLEQLQSVGRDFSSLLLQLQGTPWVVAFAVMALTCEACRRRVWRARNRLAPAGGTAGTLTWFPSLSTGSGDEG